MVKRKKNLIEYVEKYLDSDCLAGDMEKFDCCVMSPTFLEEVYHEGHVVYHGKLRYKKDCHVERRLKVLTNQLTKLFDKVEEVIEYLDKNESSLRLDTREAARKLMPLKVWKSMFYDTLGIRAPMTLSESLSILDDEMIDWWRMEEVRIYNELSEEEEKDLIEKFSGDGLEYVSLIKCCPETGVASDLLG